MRGVGIYGLHIVPRWLPGTFMPTPLTADLEGSLTGLYPPGNLASGTAIDADTQVPVAVARALTDALLGCPQVVLSGRRDLFSWLRPGGT